MIELDTSKVHVQADFHKKIRLDVESFWGQFYFVWNFQTLTWYRFFCVGFELSLDRWIQTVWYPVKPTDEAPPPWNRMEVTRYGVRAAVDMLGFRLYVDLKPFMKKEIRE